MSIGQLQSPNLPQHPDQLKQSLIKAMQDPYYAESIGMTAYGAMAKLQKLVAGEKAGTNQQTLQGGAQAQPTVAQQLATEATPQSQGIDSLPVPESMYTAADGGIVGYAKGGDVDSTVAYNRALKESFIPDAIGMAGYGLDVLNPLTYAKRGLKRLGSSVAEKTLVADPENPGSIITRGELAEREQSKVASVAQATSNYGERQNLAEGAFGPRATYGERENLMVPDGSFDFSKANIPAPKVDEAAVDKSRAPGGIAAIPAAPVSTRSLEYVKPDDFSGQLAAMERPVVSAQEHMSKWKELTGADPFQAKAAERLAAMEAKAKDEEERAPWMALAEAGFNMAAGTSPYALQNIAAGGTKGLESLAKSKDKAAAAEEKRFALESDLARAQRAEQVAAATYGANSEQADKAAAHSDKLATLHHKITQSENRAKGEYEAKKDTWLGQQKDQQLAEDARYHDLWYKTNMEKTKKDSENLEKSIRSNETTQLKTLMSEAGDRLDKLIASGVDQTDPLYASSLQIYNGAAKALGLKTGVNVAPVAGPSAVSTPEQKSQLRSILFGK